MMYYTPNGLEKRPCFIKQQIVINKRQVKDTSSTKVFLLCMIRVVHPVGAGKCNQAMLLLKILPMVLQPIKDFHFVFFSFLILLRCFFEKKSWEITYVEMGWGDFDSRWGIRLIGGEGRRVNYNSHSNFRLDQYDFLLTAAAAVLQRLIHFIQQNRFFSFVL